MTQWSEAKNMDNKEEENEEYRSKTIKVLSWKLIASLQKMALKYIHITQNFYILNQIHTAEAVLNPYGLVFFNVCELNIVYEE